MPPDAEAGAGLGTDAGAGPDGCDAGPASDCGAAGAGLGADSGAGPDGCDADPASDCGAAGAGLGTDAGAGPDGCDADPASDCGAAGAADGMLIRPACAERVSPRGPSALHRRHGRLSAYRRSL
jgi:hypothetical protein